MKRFAGLTHVGATVALFLLLVPTANAGFITTLFARDNGGANGGAVYFDLTVGANALTITGLDVNTAESNEVGAFSFFTRSGTAVGNERTAELWTLESTGTIEAKGKDKPSPVTLASSIFLSANTLYGISLVMPTNIGHDYTGRGRNAADLSFSNADLSLSAFSASHSPFNPFGGVFAPRVWNGTLYYTTSAAQVPAPDTLALFALGLAGLGWIRRKQT